MALLKNITIYEEDKKYIQTRGTYPIAAVVGDITKEILSVSPELVINAYISSKDRVLLENTIIDILNKREYFPNISKKAMIKQIFNFMFGYGQLQQYIEDEDISDIDGVGFNSFSITKNGTRQAVDIDFGSEEDFFTYCKLMALRNGGILNENDSHCRVADISNKLRINISIPPRNISGPAISIRKHRRYSYGLQDLLNLKMLDESSLDIITKRLYLDKTILICGKGGSGKTTLLRAMLNALPEMERVLVVESDAELYPEKSYCIQQRVKRDNEGGRPITLDMLVKDGLTMSLDTYCIGEIVGAEAMPFLSACCSGHRFLTTMHAQNAHNSALRMTALARTAVNASDEKMLNEMFFDGVDSVVYMNSFAVHSILDIDKNLRNHDTQPFVTVYEKEKQV